MSVINCMSYLIEYRKKSEIIEITTELSREGLSDDIYIVCGLTVLVEVRDLTDLQGPHHHRHSLDTPDTTL